MERLAYLVSSWARILTRRWRHFGALGVIITLAACSENQNPPTRDFVELAAWDAKTSTLSVTGHANGDGTVVVLENANGNKAIGSTLVTNQHYWRFKQINPDIVPCKIKAIAGARQKTMAVKNAPATCNTITQRAAPVAVTTAAPRTALLATIPDGRIVAPSRDMVVNPGTPITFSAIATSPASAGPVSYLWNFDGGVPNVNIQNPGTITFNVPGTYRINLTVSNNAGVDPTPATRVITVAAATTASPAPTGAVPAPGTTAAAPIANIDTPMGLQSIQAGDSLFFSGSGFDPNGNVNSTLNYLWDFGGGAPNSTVQVPGLVTFSQTGVFIVSLVVTDSAGNRSLNNPTITVIVGNQVNANVPPTGVILAPNADMTVPAGTALFFQGSGVDLDGNLPLTYAWDFGGVAPSSDLQNPGMIAFMNPGIFTIRLTVTDSAGAADPNSPVRTITVTPGAGTTNNDLPDGQIVVPAADITVNLGDPPIDFVALGTTPNPANEPLTYLWDFGDPAIPPVAAQAAPQISFTTPGTYTVTLTVTDAIGQVDPTPAQIIVSVLDPNAPPPGGGGVGPAPGGLDSEIISPPRRGSTFGVGEPVGFIGLAEGGVPPYAYVWNFGDPNIPDSTEQFPTIAYAAPGEYLVTLMVTDAIGNIDPTPPQRMITIIDGGAGGGAFDPPPGGNPGAGGAATDPNAPMGIILSPANDMSISPGDSVDFAAEGIDPNGLPLVFVWDFGRLGGSTSQNPGSVTFDQPGNYEIEMTVINANGIPDPSPAAVTIRVGGPPP